MSKMLAKYYHRYCMNNRIYCVWNIFGIVYVWGMIISLLYFGSESCYELESADKCFYYVSVGQFVVFECFLNFVAFHYYKYRNRLDYILPPGSIQTLAWEETSTTNGDENKVSKLCSTCKRVVPKRSHHCSLCESCVMKNDHHCFALGACVGYGNQRHFIIFIFWALIGAIYGTYFVARYMHNYVKAFTLWSGIVDYFFPLALIKWIFVRQYDFDAFGYIFLISAGYAAACGAIMFFVLQWIVILRGVTTYEMFTARKKKEPMPNDGQSYWTRIEYVFGPYWYLNFLVPLPYKNRMDENLKTFLYECQMKNV